MRQIMDQRKYSTTNMWPEETLAGRVAQLMAGASKIDHGEPCNKLVKSSSSNYWLACQMLQPDTLRISLQPSYVIPNWVKFFRCRRDRSVAASQATVADRIDWARCTTRNFNGPCHCTRLTLPLFVSDAKMEEIESDS